MYRKSITFRRGYLLPYFELVIGNVSLVRSDIRRYLFLVLKLRDILGLFFCKTFFSIVSNL